MFQTHVSSVSSVFFCMLQVLHLNVSKVDRGVVHEMRVGSGRGCEQSPRTVWRRGLAAGAGTRKSDVVGALAHSLRGHRPMLAPRVGHPGSSKSVLSYELENIKLRKIVAKLCPTYSWRRLMVSWRQTWLGYRTSISANTYLPYYVCI